MVKKLISGGQTGADISIIGVGRRLNIPIGGLVPKGWMTEAGPNPSLKAYGFIEADKADYRFRTIYNIDDSDATLVCATDPESDGTRLTIDRARAVEKPYLLVNPFERSAIETVREWLATVSPATLNVAGNRESIAPGIAKAAERVLLATIADVVDC